MSKYNKQYEKINCLTINSIQNVEQYVSLVLINSINNKNICIAIQQCVGKIFIT